MSGFGPSVPGPGISGGEGCSRQRRNSLGQDSSLVSDVPAVGQHRRRGSHPRRPDQDRSLLHGSQIEVSQKHPERDEPPYRRNRGPSGAWLGHKFGAHIGMRRRLVRSSQGGAWGAPVTARTPWLEKVWSLPSHPASGGGCPRGRPRRCPVLHPTRRHRQHQHATPIGIRVPRSCGRILARQSRAIILKLLEEVFCPASTFGELGHSTLRARRCHWAGKSGMDVRVSRFECGGSGWRRRSKMRKKRVSRRAHVSLVGPRLVAAS